MANISSDDNQQDIIFSVEEANKLRDTVKLYEAVKAFILFGEEISPSNYTLPQILKELRDAFDHFMRVAAVKTGVNTVKEENYVDKNLDKVFGHVFRCAYDVLDWVSIILRKKIQVELEEYSSSTISVSIPTYYTTIKPNLENKIPQAIARVRELKDVGAPEQKNIEEYTHYVAELKQYWETIVNAKPSLIDCSRREKRTNIRRIIISALIGAAITAVVAIIIN